MTKRRINKLHFFPRKPDQAKKTLHIVSASLPSLIAAMIFCSQAYANNIIILDDNFCPYSCSNNKKEGYIVDLVRTLLPSRSYNIALKIVPFKRAIAMTTSANEKSDNIYLMYSGKKEFHNQLVASKVIHQDQLCFFTKKTHDWQYSGIDSSAIKLGIVNGYSYQPLRDFIGKEEQKEVTHFISSKNANTSLIQQLIANRVDAITGLQAHISYLAEEHGVADTIRNAGCSGTVNLYLQLNASSPESQKILDAINTNFIKDTYQEEIKSLQKKYFEKQLKREPS